MRRDNRRYGKKGVIFLLLMFVTALSVLLLLGTGYFNVNQIEVEGNNFVEEEKIIDICGIKEGINIFKIRNRQIEKNLEDHPYILQAHVEQDYPSTVIISIEERDMVGYVRFMGSYLLLDTEGRIVDASPDMPIRMLPVFNGIQVKDFKLEQIISIENPEVFNEMRYVSEKVVECISDYSPIEIDTTDTADVRFNLDDRFVLKIGSLDDLEYKLRYGSAILKGFYETDTVGVLDLRNREKAFFRPWLDKEEQQ